MAVIFSAAFTVGADAEISAYTPEVGTSITRVFQDGVALINSIATSDTAKVPANQNDQGIAYTFDATYPSADYELQWTFVGGPTLSTRPGYFFVRYQDNSNMYAVRYFNNANGFQLYKKVSGSWSTVGSAVTIATGSVCKLKISGTTLELFDDGVSVASGTVSDISSAGKGGCAAGGGTFGTASTDDVNVSVQFDDVSVNDLGGAAAVIPPKRINLNQAVQRANL